MTAISRQFFTKVLVAMILLGSTGDAWAQAVKPSNIKGATIDKWVTATGKAEGTNLTAQDEAIADALRKAVEQTCGTFLTTQSKTQDYKLVYDRIFNNAVGYVREYKVKKVLVADQITHAEITARVSTQKFEKQWAVIAHTVHREGNPRVIIAITDATWTTTTMAHSGIIASTVQGKLEELFLSKGLQLVDRSTSEKVNKRDIILAGLRDDIQELAALGSRFNADVVIYGQASARYGNKVRIASHDAYKFVATLNVRAIRTDSAQLMVSRTFGPVTQTSLQYGGGREKALAKLAEQSAPKLLTAVVEAWRKQIHVTRNIRLNISQMDYDAWRIFRQEAKNIRGIKDLHLREITESVANIDVEYEFSTQTLADRLSELKNVNLKVVEFNPNRLKLNLLEVE